jgi:hypothetical protein
MKAGERVLLPAVRAASADTLLVADGFSCREQIAQATDRRALHLADLMQMAIDEGPDGPRGDYPERRYVADYAAAARAASRRALVAVGVGAGVALAIAAARRRRSRELPVAGRRA